MKRTEHSKVEVHPESPSSISVMVNRLTRAEEPTKRFSIDESRMHLYTKTPEGKIMDVSSVETQTTIVGKWRRRYIASWSLTLGIPALVALSALPVLWLVAVMPLVPKTFGGFLMHGGAWLGGVAVFVSSIFTGRSLIHENGRLRKMREVATENYKTEQNRLRSMQGKPLIDYDWWKAGSR